VARVAQSLGLEDDANIRKQLLSGRVSLGIV
jgi:hypothetical protein